MGPLASRPTTASDADLSALADDDPPELLDHEGAEVVLVGTDEDISEDLGIRLDPQRETEHTAEIFTQLRMEKDQHPTEPLFRGKWR